jgi:hypothetical protein
LRQLGNRPPAARPAAGARPPARPPGPLSLPVRPSRPPARPPARPPLSLPVWRPPSRPPARPPARLPACPHPRPPRPRPLARGYQLLWRSLFRARRPRRILSAARAACPPANRLGAGRPACLWLTKRHERASARQAHTSVAQSAARCTATGWACAPAPGPASLGTESAARLNLPGPAGPVPAHPARPGPALGPPGGNVSSGLGSPAHDAAARGIP